MKDLKRPVEVLWVLLAVIVVAAMLILAGCVSCPGDELRIVNPVTWHELEAAELHDRCMDWDEKTRGCVISGAEGDHIYTLPVQRP